MFSNVFKNHFFRPSSYIGDHKSVQKRETFSVLVLCNSDEVRYTIVLYVL